MYYWVLLVIGILAALVINPLVMGKRKVTGGFWSVLVIDLLGTWVGDLAPGDWGWMLTGSGSVLTGGRPG